MLKGNVQWPTQLDYGGWSPSVFESFPSQFQTKLLKRNNSRYLWKCTSNLVPVLAVPPLITRLHNLARTARTQPLQPLTCSVIRNVTADWNTSHSQL